MAKGIIETIDELIVQALKPDQKEKLSGTEVVRLLQQSDSQLNENTIRQRLSVLSKDPASEVAKLDGQNGYYKRSEKEIEAAPVDPSGRELETETRGRHCQPEEKFRFLVHAWLDQQAGEEPIYIEHTRSRRGKDGLVNKWKFPDLVSVRWTLPRISDPEAIRHDWSFQTAMQNLGEPVFSLKSIELKPSVNKSNVRGYFFQALSNSRWAHEAQLLIAEPLEGIVADELRRLGASYGLTVAHFGLSMTAIEDLPEAKKKNSEEYRKIAKDIDATIVVQGQKQDTLDWEHIFDISNYLTDFKDVFDYVDSCCSSKKAIKFDVWRNSIRDA